MKFETESSAKSATYLSKVAMTAALTLLKQKVNKSDGEDSPER